MNPLLETVGQVSAIIICVFVLVLIVLTVAFNLAMAFGMSWLSEKIDIIKMLRPTVESVNKTTKSALKGIPPTENQHGLIRAAASIPPTVHSLEKKVDQGTDKVADVVIEFRARTVQAKTMLKAFFLPGLTQRKQQALVDEAGLELNSSDSQGLMEERSTDIPVEAPPIYGHTELIASADQVQHATIR